VYKLQDKLIVSLGNTLNGMHLPLHDYRWHLDSKTAKFHFTAYCPRKLDKVIGEVQGKNRIILQEHRIGGVTVPHQTRGLLGFEFDTHLLLPIFLCTDVRYVLKLCLVFCMLPHFFLNKIQALLKSKIIKYY